MKILHVVPGLEEGGNGIAVAARLIAAEQGADLTEARLFAGGDGELDGYDEVWVHSCWLPMTLKSCRRVLRAGKPLVRMMHGNLDPVRLKYHGWMKRLVGPIERGCLRRCDRIVATCAAEKEWIEAYLGKKCPVVEVTDIKRFFKLERDFGRDGKTAASPKGRDSLHILYLGRRHPLKGVEYLETAVKGIEGGELRVVCNAFGDEKERVWDWCDVLVLPTLSENFGLVVAEALERGKRVITTDGAPAWGKNLSRVEHVERVEGGLWSGYEGRLIYLKGYRDGTDEERVELLRRAIELMSVGEMMAVS